MQIYRHTINQRKKVFIGGLFLLLACVGGVFALRDTALANMIIGAWTGMRLNSGLVLHYTFDGKDIIGGAHTAHRSTGFLYPAAHSALSGYGDGNGFEITQGSGGLSAVDNAGLTDLSSGSGNLTDGCGTFPQGEDDLHVFRDFNISLPSGATVNGINININGSSTLTGTNRFCVALSWDSGTTTAKDTGDMYDTTYTYRLGSQDSDLWGRVSWSATDLSNANFRVYVMPDTNNSNARNFFLDSLAISVSYYVAVDDSAALVADASGNGNNGSVEFGTPMTGKIGQGMEFGYAKRSGVNGGSAAMLDNMTQKTGCSWIYPRSFGESYDDSTILAKIPGWGFELGDDQGQGLYLFDLWDGGFNSGMWHSTFGVIKLNEWQHVCFSYDKSSTTNDPVFYINGIIQGTVEDGTPSGSPIDDSGYNFYAGWWLGSPNGSFDGVLDDVRLYNRILGAEEIKRLYLMGASLKVNSSHRNELTDGLAAYWTFDGKDMDPNIRDASGQGRHGGLQNQNPTTTAIGRIGQGLSFDGSDDVIIFSNPSLGTVNTAALWIDWRDSVDGVVIGGTTGDYALYLDATNAYYSAQSGGNFVTVAHGGLTGGEWTHLAVVRNGTSVTFYKNGSKIGTTQTLSANDTLNVTRLGAYDDGNFPSTMRLDDVRLYTRALSADEIKRLYYMGSSLKLNSTKRTELTSGLVGYWTFDGKDVDWSTGRVNDVSGQGNYAGMVGGISTTTGPTPGKIGQGLFFDGVDDKLVIGNPSALQITGSLTLSVWVKPSMLRGQQSNGRIFGKSTGSSFTYGLELSGCSWVDHFLFFVSSDGSATAQRCDNAVLATSTWTHVASVYNATNQTIDMYINGSLSNGEITGTVPTSLLNNSNVVTMGRRDGAGNIYPGVIDEVRVYNRPLSAEEINQLYLMGK